MNLWGFVSIMLALLFLLIGDPYPHHPGVSVDLPVVQNAVSEPYALREDVMRVTVTSDGLVYFRQTRIVRKEDLPSLIRTALREGAERKVYLVADARAKYAAVEIVLNQIRLAGIANVAILAVESRH